MTGMPHMIRLKGKKNLPADTRYIYINVASIHAIQPNDGGSMIYFGSDDHIYVEHQPRDIVFAIDNGHVYVKDGAAIGSE